MKINIHRFPFPGAPLLTGCAGKPGIARGEHYSLSEKACRYDAFTKKTFYKPLNGIFLPFTNLLCE